MRPRIASDERTSFQEGGPFDVRIDSKADVAMVYGLGSDLEQRLSGWGAAGYRLHVMTGVSWGHYADYVRGDWDGVAHFDDAQTATGGFRLEHGINQGHDIYYMLPSQTYAQYLAEKLHRVIDSGALALHLEEPEYWVRAGYEDGFKREWQSYYGEVWQDPVSSPDARYRCEKLKQHLYTRALAYLFADIKRYARDKGIPDFKCYVPTHSLLNYAHWRIVSPESKLLQVPDCDGLIGQVWTGTSRTPNIYRGVAKERTFETGYCEYASCGAMVRGTKMALWQLADPIEDNPNYSWQDYRRCWECDVTASLLSPDNVRFEIAPWPSRVFTRSYPRENLDSKPLSDIVAQYTERLQRTGKPEQAEVTKGAIAEFSAFYREHKAEMRLETLGFANLATVSDDLRFGDILSGAFAFYRYLSTKPDQFQAAQWRDALSAFYHDPTDDREFIPPSYATELQVVFNALGDMAWPGEYQWIHGQTGVGIGISDTLMYQRGEPSPSDSDMSSFYGLAMPMIKNGVALSFAQLERITDDMDKQYLDGMRVLMLTYEGMKPPNSEVHAKLVGWVRQGNALVLFGIGDSYDHVREWWNADGASDATPQMHLTYALGIGQAPAEGQYKCGKGVVIIEPASPSVLAHQTNGADIVVSHVQAALEWLGLKWSATNALVFRRGPYIVAGGIDETAQSGNVTLTGPYVDLFDHRLRVLDSPTIAPDTRWLLVDPTWYKAPACVIAAAGRVSEEVASKRRLTFRVEGMAQTICAVRVKLPASPTQTIVGEQLFASEWEPKSMTALLEFANHPSGVVIKVEW